jgi:hypothetical protein
MRIVPRNDQCPERSYGLWHIAGEYGICVYCRNLTAAFAGEAPVVRLAPPVPEVRKVADRRTPDRLCSGCAQPTDIEPCADCRTQRHLNFWRLLHEAGHEMEEPGPIVPLPRERAGAGSLVDWEATSRDKAVGNARKPRDPAEGYA